MEAGTAGKGAGLFAKLLLPAIVLQSLIIGGGYSTGREVVEYAGRFGPAGWLALLIIIVGFSLISILAFELARVFRTYDYKSWIRQLIGPLWPLFDLLVVVMMLLVIAVMAAAMGSILRQTLGLPEQVGLLVAFTVVAFLAYTGEGVLERFKTVGTAVLYTGYLLFSLLVLSRVGGAAPASPPAPVPPPETVGVGAVLLSGVLYVGYNLSVYPAVLWVLHRQTERRETVLSGLLSGIMMTVPFALTFLCLLAFYPDQQVLGAEVPWLVMLERVGGSWVVVVFGVVAGWTLVETAVGGIHALVDRLEKNLEDIPFAHERGMTELRPWQRCLLAVGVLAVAVLLARVGIIALVARGYSLLAYGFIALVAVPLLTIGAYRIRASDRPAGAPSPSGRGTG